MNESLHRDLFDTIQKHSIKMSYAGAISQEILEGFVEYLKGTLYHETKQMGLTKKVYSIFIEMAQNISANSLETTSWAVEGNTKPMGRGIITISEDEKVYTITTGNLVNEDRAKYIIQQCEYINKLDAEALRAHYKQQLRRLKENSHELVSIGLIEIARKSQKPIGYSMQQVNDRNSLFFLSVNIDKGNTSHE